MKKETVFSDSLSTKTMKNIFFLLLQMHLQLNFSVFYPMFQLWHKCYINNNKFQPFVLQRYNLFLINNDKNEWKSVFLLIFREFKRQRIYTNKSIFSCFIQRKESYFLPFGVFVSVMLFLVSVMFF